MKSPLKLLVVGGCMLFLLVVCFYGHHRAQWSGVYRFFLRDTVTLNGVKGKMSERAFDAIVNTDTSNQLIKVKAFFADLTPSDIYTVLDEDSVKHISFNHFDPMCVAHFSKSGFGKKIGILMISGLESNG